MSIHGSSGLLIRRSRVPRRDRATPSPRRARSPSSRRSARRSAARVSRSSSRVAPPHCGPLGRIGRLLFTRRTTRPRTAVVRDFGLPFDVPPVAFARLICPNHSDWYRSVPTNSHDGYWYRSVRIGTDLYHSTVSAQIMIGTALCALLVSARSQIVAEGPTLDLWHIPLAYILYHTIAAVGRHEHQHFPTAAGEYPVTGPPNRVPCRATPSVASSE